MLLKLSLEVWHSFCGDCQFTMTFAVNSCLLPCKAFAAIALSSFVYDLSERLDFKKDFC